MTINRRTAIRQLAIISAGAALLPSCLHPHAKPSVSLKNITLTGDQEKSLEELTATLIPTDTTPGARDVSAHLLVLRMVDDCSPKADQEKFIKGLVSFDEASRLHPESLLPRLLLSSGRPCFWLSKAKSYRGKSLIFSTLPLKSLRSWPIRRLNFS